MTKQYSYTFSYYWKISWPDEDSFKKDAPNYKGFKQRVKRDWKTVSDKGVFLYINLKWVTTLGKMQSLFPTALAIEVSTAEEFAKVKVMEEVKPSNVRRTFRLKRKLEPTDEYSYCIKELDVKPSISMKTRTGKTSSKSIRSTNEFEEESSDYMTDQDLDPVKKKLHIEAISPNMQNYPVSPINHISEQYHRNNSEASTSIRGDPIIEDDLTNLLPRIEELPPSELSFNFLDGDNREPYKLLTKLSSDDLTPPRIRNLMENSMRNIYLDDDDSHQNF